MEKFIEIPDCIVCGEKSTCNAPNGGYKLDPTGSVMIPHPGDPLCDKCFESNMSCCGDWIDDEIGLCPTCGEHCK